MTYIVTFACFLNKKLDKFDYKWYCEVAKIS